MALVSGNGKKLELKKDEINKVRFGLKWVRGFEFVIGRVYCIDISNGADKMIQIRLKSFYGRNKLEMSEKYNGIINHIYKFCLDEKVLGYVKKINHGEEVKIAEMIFNEQGVSLNEKNRDDLTPWENLNARAYSSYYALADKNQANKHKSLYYLTDWNAALVYSLTRYVLRERGLLRE